MVLSISRKVDVKPGVIAPAVTENIQNCLLLSNQDKFINHEILVYNSAKEVSDYFGTDSKEANFARTYFGGFVGAAKRPERLLIAQNYSLQARPASITSTFFTSTEEPNVELKNIGATEATPAIVVSSSIYDERYLVDTLKNLMYPESRPSSIESAMFDSESTQKQDIFQILNQIGQDDSNYGDFSIVFNVDDNDTTITAGQIDLSEAENLEDALSIIQDKINTAITASDLGEDFKVNLTIKNVSSNNDLYLFSISTQNAGSKYNITKVFSTVPSDNIATILKLSDEFEPEKEPGVDEVLGDFSISFDVSGVKKTATTSNLDFSLKDNLEDQLSYLTTEINSAIESTPDLGAAYKVTIEKQVYDEDDPDSEFAIVVKTNNTGSTYIMDEISSTSKADVASILRLSNYYEPSFYPGSEKELGDFSIMFNVGYEKIIATAKNLDFSIYDELYEQLSYLTNELNKAISGTEKLGNDYLVDIKTNELQDGMYNVSVTTTNSGSIYSIDSVFSKIPLDGKRVDEILKLSLGIQPAPTIVDGIDQVQLSEVLDNYANSRSDWWTVSTTESVSDVNMEISNWVNTTNNGCRYVFIAHDKNELANTTMNNSSTFGYTVYTSGLKGTSVIFGDETHAGFIAGLAASIDYSRKNGTLTFSGKRQDGLEMTANTDREANCLESNYYNYYGSYSSINSKYRFFETGIVSGSDGQNWLDSLFNQIWLLMNLQTSILNLLIDKNKIPFNNTGYSLISTACDDTINQAINNGIITTGVNLDAYQISIVNEAVGKDVSNDLYENGYYLYIGDNTIADRVKRNAKNCFLFYCDGGAIQKISFALNVLL